MEKIDEIDMSGTDEEKRKILLNLLRQKNVVIPQFYDKRFCRNGLRYPGDGGPDPQVETDHESEEDKEDVVNEFARGSIGTQGNSVVEAANGGVRLKEEKIF